MTPIFLNYRRQGEAYAAALLDERLSARFGPDQIFRASRSIRAGEDYGAAILNAIEQCRVMLVIVGPDWTGHFTKGSSGKTDWVHQEISKALEQGIAVIPVLLSGVGRIEEEGLPQDIAQLAKNQYLRFDYRNLDQDAEKITSELERFVSASRSRRGAKRFSRSGR